jgi:conjugal transfer pilus assembly protein TraF
LYIRSFRCVLSAVVLVLAASSGVLGDVFADSALLATLGPQNTSDTPKSFFDDSKRGWYWYENPKKEEDLDGNQKEIAQKRFVPSLKDYSKDELWNMHPDDFQPLLQAFLKKSVQYPTLENVREYFIVQDIARAKANAFANVSELVKQKYPELSLQREFPASAAGNAAKITMQARETKDRIRQSRDEFALIFFYSRSCEFCTTEEGILRLFVDRYGWEVGAVEINEKPDIAARFDVQTVPYLMLIHRGSKEYFPIASGVVAIDEIENRLYQGIRLLSGEITPEEYSLYEYQREGGFDPSRYEGHKDNKSGGI